MNNPDPYISVYLATRNRAGQLEQALHSVMNQTLPPDEVIVVDDASDDSTPEMLKTLKQQYAALRICRNETRKGASASRNLAIKKAAGEYITGIDDDDVWLPERLEKLSGSMTQDSRCAGVCSFDLMDDGKRKIVWKKPLIIRPDDLLYYNMAGNQVLSKRRYILQAGGFDETLPSAQDYDLWIRLAFKFGPIRTVPETLQIINMRENEDRITTSGKKTEGYRACFEKHFPKMNTSHIKYQKYRLKLASGESAGWRELLASTPCHLLIKEITRKLFLQT